MYKELAKELVVRGPRPKWRRRAEQNKIFKLEEKKYIYIYIKGKKSCVFLKPSGTPLSVGAKHPLAWLYGFLFSFSRSLLQKVSFPWTSLGQSTAAPTVWFHIRRTPLGSEARWAAYKSVCIHHREALPPITIANPRGWRGDTWHFANGEINGKNRRNRNRNKNKKRGSALN